MIMSWSNGIGLSEWNCWSSGLHSEVISVGRRCCTSNAFTSRAMSLRMVSRSGLLPYPRYMSSSLAPEWIRVRVGRRLKMIPTRFLCFGGILPRLMNCAGTSTSFAVALIHSDLVKCNHADILRALELYEIFGAIGCTAVPGSRRIQNLGKRAGRKAPQ